MTVPYYGDFAEDDTVDMLMNTFDSNDPTASVTITNFLNTDVHIHKDLGTTQRNNAAGITVSIDFDSITGNHAVKIDTSDNTVAGFYVTGSEYQVRVEGATVDGGTINVWIGSFSIERAGGAIALLKTAQADLDLLTGADGATLATAQGNYAPSKAGDLMGLANDAITSAKYDESTAFPLTAVNGSTLTEAGGDGDHLTAINLPNQTMDIIGSITGNLIGDVTGNVDGTVAGKTPSEAGDAMNLAADAIKKVSYDETTAWPLLAADTGATEIARTGADSDTLETLSDEIAALNDIAASDVWDAASARTEDFGTLLERLADWHFNEKTVTDATGAVLLRNQGDSGDLASWGITDNATITVSTEVSWP